MKKKRFTEEQIVQILQEAEGGLSVTEVCRKHNCSEQSFYRLGHSVVGNATPESRFEVRPI